MKLNTKGTPFCRDPTDHPVPYLAVALHSLLALQELSQSGFLSFFLSFLIKTGLCVRKRKIYHNMIDWTSVQIEKVPSLWCETLYKKHMVWEKARSLYKCFHTHELRDLWMFLDIISPHQCQGSTYRPKEVMCWNGASYQECVRKKVWVPRIGLISFQQHQKGIRGYKTPSIRPSTNTPAKILCTFERSQRSCAHFSFLTLTASFHLQYSSSSLSCVCSNPLRSLQDMFLFCFSTLTKPRELTSLTFSNGPENVSSGRTLS